MPGQDVISTRLEITGEATYRQKMKQVALGMKQINSEGKVTEATFGKADRSVAKLTATYAQMEKRLTLQKTKLAAVGEEYDRIVKLEGENSDSARRLAAEYNRASAEVIRLEKDMEDLNDEITKSSSGWDRAIKSAGAIQEKYSRLGNTMQSVGKRIATVTLAASSAVIGSAAKAYMDLADSMAVVYTIADKTAVPMEDMMRATVDASNELGTAATELAAAEYQAISAGVDTASAVDFVAVAAKGAKAGMSDVTTVVDASTSIINAWGYAWEDATKIMDKMLVAQQYGKTTVNEISQSIGNLTGLAPQLGMSFEEIMAATAALTKNGVSTAQSMTGLRGVMSAVLKPTAEATKLADSLGLEFNAAAMQSKGFAGFLEDVLEKTGGSSEQLAVLFGQVEGLSAVMSLAGSAAGDFSDALIVLENSSGVLDEQFAARMDSPAQKLEKALNRIRNAGISFGQTLAPYIDIAAQSLERLGEVLGSLSSEQQMALVKTAAWVAGIGGAVAVAGKLITSLKTLATVGKLVFSGPVGWVVGGALAVGGLTAALIKLTSTTKDVDEAWASLQSGFDSRMAEKVALIIGAEVDTSPAISSITAAMTELSDNIITQLTDGLPDDDQTIESLKADVASRFSKLVGAVEQQLEAELASLNPDDADYNQQCAAIVAKAETTKTELAAMEQEYYGFIDTYAGKSAATVKAHVGELDTLNGKVAELTAAIEAYNQAQQTVGAHSSSVVMAGATTDAQTIAEAWQHHYQTYRLGLEKYAAQRDAEVADLNKRFAESDGKMTEEVYAASLEGINRIYEENMSAEEIKWRNAAERLLAGMEEGFALIDPESVDAAQTIADKMNLREILQQELDRLGEDASSSFDTSILAGGLEDYFAKAASKLNVEDYEKALSKGGMSAVALVTAVSRQLNDDIYDAAAGIAENPYLEMLNAIFSSDAGAALGVDTTSMKSVLSAAAGNLSTATIGGYTKGIEDGTADIETATAGLMESGIAAAKDALDSNSPSRVYRELGHDAIDGMVLGVQDRRNKLINVMREIARAAVNAAREELDIHSPSRVMYDMGVQTAQGYINAINHQIGAVQSAMQHFTAPQVQFTPGGAVRPQTAAAMPVAGGSTTINVQYSAPYGRKEALRFGGVLAQGMNDAKKAYGG